MKILIVDDEKFNLVVAKATIEENLKNHEVILCNSPSEVLSMIEEHNVDIILLDIVMPKVNGITVLQQIRSKDEYKNIQVLMFTSINDKESFRICFENGADDYISKPIDSTEFVARMRAAIATRRNVIRLKNAFVKMEEQYKMLEKLTNELKTAQDHLLQQEKLAALGGIAAGIAHEINNPLGYVSSNLETMAKYLTKIKGEVDLYRTFAKAVFSEPENVVKYSNDKSSIEQYEKQTKFNYIMEDLSVIVKDSRDGIDRVANIVKNLWHFATTETEGEMATNDLNQMLNEVLLVIQNEVNLVAIIKKNLQKLPLINCEKSQIRQVMLSILINSVQAIKSQKRQDLGLITVETYTDDLGYAVCVISDDGPGIKEEHLSKVFNPFFTTKEVGAGTGLGLSSAYGIIKKHGGDLIAESEYGKGASFIIKIPIDFGVKAVG